MHNIINSWFVQGMIKATSDAWLKGWDERNGGNLTLRLDEADIAPFKADFHPQPRYIALSQPMPELANQPFIVTGSGKFFRNVQLDPAANLGVVKVDNDGAGYFILWGLTEEAVPTSELPAHFLSHCERIKATGGKDRVIMHCHATNLIALTYVLENNSDLFTRKLWEGSTECLVVFPDGVGILPWMVPGTDEIGQATAGEMTSNAVIIDSERQVKEVIIDPNIIPDIAVDDASVMLDIPPSVTAATGMDALTHAIEAFVSVGAHPLTDANALEAIRLIHQWLPLAVDDGHNLQAREQMAYGQYLAGMAFNSAGLGLVHALAHQPGATHNLPHGVCNAILLPIIENFNRPNAVARFARIAQAMGVDTRGMSDETASMAAINAIRALSKRVGIPEGFSQLGVSKADIEGWLDKALADPCAPCNPRSASRDEVRELYLEAL